MCQLMISQINQTFNKRSKVIPIPFFIPDFILLTCKLSNFVFKESSHR